MIGHSIRYNQLSPASVSVCILHALCRVYHVFVQHWLKAGFLLCYLLLKRVFVMATAVDNNFFEGTEKLLEIWFGSSDPSNKNADLRLIDRLATMTIQRQR